MAVKETYLNKDEKISSSTFSIEALLATLAMCAHEKREVVTFNFSGASLHAEIPPEKGPLLKLKDNF